jgi:hypothetical protein
MSETHKPILLTHNYLADSPTLVFAFFVEMHGSASLQKT